MELQFITIVTRERRYLLRISDIQEIISMLLLTPIDGQSGAFRGMANVRGAVIPIFDLSGEYARLSPTRFILICRIAERQVGFIADEVHDIVGILEENLIEQPIGGGKKQVLTRIGDEVLSILDPADVLARIS